MQFVISLCNSIADESSTLINDLNLLTTLYQPNTNKKLTIATIYRHPSQATDKFVEDFLNCLEKLTYEKKNVLYLR